MILNNKTTLKLKNQKTTYKILDIELTCLQDLKTYSFNKFGLIAMDCNYIAKIDDDKKISLNSDEDLKKCLDICKTNSKGEKLLCVTLKDKAENKH